MQKRGAKVIKSFELASEAREKTLILIFAAKVKGKYSYVTAEPSKKRFERKPSANIKDF